MKVTIKEVPEGYIVYILDEASGRPIEGTLVETLEEAQIKEKEFNQTVASMD